jgi:hypothetical protein
MATNQPNIDEKKGTQRPPNTAADPEKGPEKRKKDPDDDTRNSGFRSSRIRESESRTTETGDPSVS